jgi:hypothetical protein
MTPEQRADVMWRIHPRELQDRGITRADYFAEQIRDAIAEQRDEIERLQFLRASDAARLEKYYAEIERLNAIKTAADKAYRYHMLGYKDPDDFNANVMLDLMNELGALL